MAAPTTASSAEIEMDPLAGAVILALAVTALVVTWLAGVLRPGSISGPARLRPGESAWTLVGILGGSVGGLFFASTAIAVAAQVLGLPLRNLFVATAIAYFFGLLFLLLLTSLLRRRAAEAMGLGARRLGDALRPALVSFLIVLPLVYGVSIAVLGLWKALGLPPPPPHPLLKAMESMRTPGGLALLLLNAVVLAPLYEELLFRGLLQTALVGRKGFGVARAWPGVEGTAEGIPNPEPRTLNPSLRRWLAVIITSAIFAAIHVQPAFMPPLLVLSLALGYLYERTGNLWACILLHALFNGAQVTVFLLVGPPVGQ